MEKLPDNFSSGVIDRVAAKQLGQAPAAAPAAAKPTKESAAIEALSPNNPSDSGADSAAVMYAIDMGDGKTENLTPSQISGVMNRYKDMNHKNAMNSNLLKVVEAAIKGGMAKDPDDAARQLLALMRAGKPNPEMGGDGKPAQRPGEANDPASSPDAMARAMSQWEDDNAVSLPPGYKEMFKSMNSEMAGLKKMLGDVLKGGLQQGDQAARLAVDAKTDKASAMTQRIENVLNGAAQHVGLTSEDARDFKMYAAELGYVQHDFSDPTLTVKLMTAFKNSKNSDEFTRLKELHGRRQAFTGSVPSATSTPGGGQTQGAPDATLGRLTDGAISKRMG